LVFENKLKKIKRNENIELKDPIMSYWRMCGLGQFSLLCLN